jgi:hypothetical protein
LRRSAETWLAKCQNRKPRRHWKLWLEHGTDRCTASRTGCQTSEGTEREIALISYGVLWPAVVEEFVPYALGGTALLVIGQFAAVKLDFQYFAECCPFVQWDESENVVG